ncbi:hypothetical protein CYMTET_40440, partial [Cymbomonas tetramitiformis]
MGAPCARNPMFYAQILALLKKSFLLFKRSRRDALREVLMPAFYLLLLVFLRRALRNDGVITFRRHDILLETQSPCIFNECTIGVAPCSRTFSCHVKPSGGNDVDAVCFALSRLRGYSSRCFGSASEMHELVAQEPGRLYAGIEFEVSKNASQGLRDLPTVPYTIWMNHTNVSYPEHANMTGAPGEDPTGEMCFVKSGLAALQHAINMAVVQLSDVQTKVDEVWTAAAPFKPYVQNLATSTMAFILPLYMNLIFSLQ